MSDEKKPLSTEDAVKLLDLLASDDAFREIFSQDPAQALQSISPAAAESGNCCLPGGPLASKEEFQQSRDQLLQHLAANAAFYVPHCFVTGQIDASLQRKPKP